MRVNINGASYDYDIVFSKAKWKKQAHDYFLFPERVGGNPCFIKRFARMPSTISGWNLMASLLRKEFPNLPKIYDIKSQEENGKRVFYVFYEYIEGATLDKALDKGVYIKPIELAKDIYNALEVLFDLGFWFPDFVEKNFMLSKNGRCYLIDLDSAHPLTDLPNPSKMYGSKNYWGPVYSTYKKELGYQALRFESINGAVLNSLQLVFLLAHFKYYLDKDEVDIYSPRNIHALPEYVILHPLGEAIFRFSLRIDGNGKTVFGDINFKLIENLIRNVLFPEQEEIYILSKVLNPKVEFKLNGKKKKNQEVEMNDVISLSWNVKHAQEVLLSHCGKVPFKGRKEFLVDQDIDYELCATSDFKGIKKQVKEKVKVKVRIPKPVIKKISINGATQRGAKVKLGKVVKIEWEVENTTEVRFSPDFPSNAKLEEGKCTFKPSESCDYELIAINEIQDKKEIIKESININVEYPAPAAPQLDIKINDNSMPAYLLNEGESFTLSWETKNTKQLRLDGKFCGLQGSRSFKADLKKTEIKFLAINEAYGQKKRVERVVELLIRPKPRIEIISAKNVEVKSGHIFHIEWLSEHAEEIEIYKNGELCESRTASHKKETYADIAPTTRKKLLLTYYLKCKNESLVSESTSIKVVVKPVRYWSYFERVATAIFTITTSIGILGTLTFIAWSDFSSSSFSADVSLLGVSTKNLLDINLIQIIIQVTLHGIFFIANLIRMFRSRTESSVRKLKIQSLAVLLAFLLIEILGIQQLEHTLKKTGLLFILIIALIINVWYFLITRKELRK